MFQGIKRVTKRITKATKRTGPALPTDPRQALWCFFAEEQENGGVMISELSKQCIGLFRDEFGVRCVAFSPDGTTLASGSTDSTIKFWDVASGKERATFRGHRHHVIAVAYSPDGKTLASPL